MMASGKKVSKPRSVPVVRARQGLPWLTIAGVVLILALIAGVFTVVYKQHVKNDDAASAVAAFVPSASDMDPSTKISGIYVGASVTSDGTISYTKYKAALHVSATQRVNYDRYPPVGGPHDAEWAACNGVVYTTAVRDENMVHPLEHGAVWIAYNPKTIVAGDIDKLKALVSGGTYIYMSPYPTLTAPISLQAWGHQLMVTSASDARIKEFITALRQNTYVAPEPNGSCDQPTFVAANFPFDAAPRTASDVQLDGSGLTADTTEAQESAVTTGSTPVTAGTPALTGAAASTTATK